MNLQEYLLVSLAEECAEVAQRATKALRFGINEIQPGQPYPNGMRLMDELDDLLLIVKMLQDDGHLPTSSSDIESKRQKVFRFMDFAEECGKLTQEWHRANGDSLCKVCKETFYRHRIGGVRGVDNRQFLHRLCDGRLVKL